ncbi:MAG: integration host factor subunit beta [Treponema sp.]|jgi:integration host factor subunit beta|nr:integration host factor subunit beta [Treponema sp.]
MAGKKYTKADLIDAVYEKTGMDRKEIRQVVDLFIEEIKIALQKQIGVELRRFGTFEVRIRKGRQGARNPRTGEPVAVKSHGAAAFRPGRELKLAVWRLDGESASPPEDGGGSP